MLHCLWNNPLRSPAWPWLRAVSIVSDGAPNVSANVDSRAGCRRVRPLLPFLRALQSVSSDRQKIELMSENPTLFWAHSIYAQPDAPAKWLIEARLLARESDMEIAARLGCTPDIIKCYHDTFFDVREKLDFRDYILHAVFGEAIYRGLHERQHDLLWKMFGYFGGPYVIDAVSSRLINATWANTPADAASFFQDAALNVMKHKAAVAAITVPINSETNLDLIGAFVKYVEIERTTESQGQAKDQIIDNIQKAMELIPFQVISEDRPLSGLLEKYDNSAVELNTDELMTVAVGADLPYADMLLSMQFPPPPAIAQAAEETR